MIELLLSWLCLCLRPAHVNHSSTIRPTEGNINWSGVKQRIVCNGFKKIIKNMWGLETFCIHTVLQSAYI